MLYFDMKTAQPITQKRKQVK